MTSKDDGVAASVARKKKNQKGDEKEVEEQEEVIGWYSGAGGQQYELRDPILVLSDPIPLTNRNGLFDLERLNSREID